MSLDKITRWRPTSLRRGKNYGTLIIDLKTHRPIDLLPDRSGTSLKAWLLAHPGVKIISRDRSTEYTRGAMEGATNAIQVADRWHVIKNLREVLERIIHRRHAKLVALQKAVQTPQGSGRIKTDGGVAVEAESQRTRQRVMEAKVARFRRQQRYQEVVELYQAGHNILQIAEELGLSRSTVRNFVYAGAFPERATILRTKSILDPYVAHLEKRWEEGCHNAKQLWREITEQGYKGGDKVVRQWAAPRRNKPGRLHSKREKARIEWQQAELAKIEDQTGFATDSANEGSELEYNLAREGYMLAPAKPLEAAKHLVWLLLRPVEKLNQEELAVLKFMRQEEAISSAYNLAQSFLRMVKERRGEELESWLGACDGSSVAELESFGASLQREFGAIAAALTLPYSNGPTEGAVNKLKMIKRTLYGRGNFEVLRRRVLLAA